VQKKSAMFILLAILCVIVYWPILKYPYVQDDWHVLKVVLDSDGQTPLIAKLFPEGQMMYRPLPWLYFALVTRFTGIDPSLHHILAMLLHTCTSLLVFLIVRRLGQKEPVPTLTALIYLAALGVHMDPLLWLVGTYDLAAAFFFYLSIALFLRGKDFWSPVAFGAALLCKEAALPLPAILFLILLLNRKETLHSIVRRLWPHVLVFSVYFVLRNSSSMPLLQVSTNPYAMSFSVARAFESVWTYLRWLAEATVPLVKSTALMSLIILTVSVLLAVRAGAVLWNRDSRKATFSVPPDFLLWPAWVIAGFLPVLFLTDHAYRYYLTYSLVPAIVMVLWIIGQVIRLFGISHRHEGIVLIGYAIVSIGFSTAFLYMQDAERWRERPLSGTNRLIGKASEVMQVQNYLQDNQAQIARHSVLLLDGLDGSLFGGSLGPQVWLKDSTVRVFPSSWAIRVGDSLLIDEKNGKQVRVGLGGVHRLEAEMEGGNWTGKIVGRGATLSP
jgi:hypothetical protein